MAEAGEADYLASGDRRGILALEQHGRTLIVTARTVIKTLGLESKQPNPRAKK
jgi:hypothetical protein